MTGSDHRARLRIFPPARRRSGRPTAVLALAIGFSARVASGAATLSFTQADHAIPGTSADSFSGVAIGDLDHHDGPDLVVPQHNAGQVFVWLNAGDGTFGAPVAHASCPGDYARPLIGEFTADGNPDLLQACADGVQFEVLPGDGAGGFGSARDAAISTQYYGLVGNLDGRPDLIYPGGFLGNWSFCFIAIADLGPGPLMPTCGGGPPDQLHADFIAANVFAPGANPPYDRDAVIKVADLHDVAFVGYDAQGPGGWSSATRTVGPDDAREVAAGDVDGDGIDDVVVANDGSLSVFLAKPNTGGIDVGAQATPGGGSLEVPYFFELADVDGDGKLDAVVGGTDGQNAPEFAVMLGHGDGTFDPPVRFGTGFDPASTAWWMRVADLDGDGKPEVVIVNGDERTVRVFRNGTTTPPSAPCDSLTTCLALLQADLPSPAGVTKKKLKKVATKLQHRFEAISKLLDQAAASTGKKRTKLYGKSRAGLRALEKAARTAATKGTLGVSLTALEGAADDLSKRIP